MAIFEDHLYAGTYPYLTPEQFVDDRSPCALARGLNPEDFVVIDAIQDASLVVYYLTGKQFDGTRTTTIRPRCECYDCEPFKWRVGLWPVTRIVTVREEGDDKDPDDYHVDEWRYIVKNSGETFPRCSNWYAEEGGEFDTDEKGWVHSITVEHGIPGPALIRRATAAFACRLLDDTIGDCEDCDLPSKLTAVSRQGVSFSIEDFWELMKSGSTGVFALDMAIKVFNPSHLQSPTWVWTPEIAGGKRRYLGFGVESS